MSLNILCAPPRGRDNARRGYSIIFLGLVMLGLFGLVSLAVDLGRVRVGRVQLASAADAAAIAGVQRLHLLTAAGDLSGERNDAVTVAHQNLAIQGIGGSTPVDLDPQNDVEFGIYRPDGGFTAVNGVEANGNQVTAQSSNACRVTATRTTARSKAVGLFFGRAIGINEVDVAGRAIAWIRGGNLGIFGFVGLDSVKFNGTTSTDSYTS